MLGLQIAPDIFLPGNAVKTVSGIAPGVPIDIQAKINAKPDSTRQLSDVILEEVTNRCGWLDPAIIAEFARINSLPDVSRQSLDGMNANEVLYPACVRMSPSTAVVETILNKDKAGLIPTSEARAEIERQREPLTRAINAATNNRRMDASPTPEVPGQTLDPITDIDESLRVAADFLAGVRAPAELDDARRRMFSNATIAASRNIIAGTTAAVAAILDAQKQKVTSISIEASDLATAMTAQRTVQDLHVGTVEAPVPALIGPANTPAALADCDGGKVSESEAYLRVRDWPFRKDRLLDALLLNAFERDRRSKALEPTRVLIADTGFPIDDFTNVTSTFRSDDQIEPRQFFTLNDFYSIEDEKGQEPDNPIDYNQDGIRGNIFGFSLETMTGLISSATDYKFRDHGMSGASMAIGGLQLNRYRMLRTMPVRLHFANLMMEPSPPAEPTMMKDRLEFLVDYARRHAIEIVNLSFTAEKPIKTLHQDINTYREALVIAAAKSRQLVTIAALSCQPGRPCRTWLRHYHDRRSSP